jgi:hypothetical protein
LNDLAGVNRGKCAESYQQKSGKSSIDGCHRFAPGGR